MTQRIVHLLDDTNPGGVTRFLEYVQSLPALSKDATHELVIVPRGTLRGRKLDADVIVSHLVGSWRNLPFFWSLRAANSKARLIHIEHSYSAAFELTHVPSRKRFRQMLSLTYTNFDAVVAVSHGQAEWLRSFVSRSDLITVLSPCVELGRFADLPLPKGRPKRIGALGRFDDQKGFDLLIKAFKEADLPDIQLDLFGDGPDKELLETLADNAPNICFHGFIDDPVKAVEHVDVIAMPSRREPYGLVALEALAAGRCLLVSDVDGLRDHARNGAVPVLEFTQKAWADALQTVVRQSHRADAIRARKTALRAEEIFTKGWLALMAG